MKTKKSAEVHISSLVIQVKPENIRAVSREVAMNEFAEVHLSSPEGKIIVILETPSRFEVTRAIDAFRTIEDVLNVVMVYHQMENAECMNDVYETDENTNHVIMETAQ